MGSYISKQKEAANAPDDETINMPGTMPENLPETVPETVPEALSTVESDADILLDSSLHTSSSSPKHMIRKPKRTPIRTIACEEPLFTLIRDRLKTVECKKAITTWTTLQPGDRVIFKRTGYHNSLSKFDYDNQILVEITKVTIYRPGMNALATYFINEGLANDYPGASYEVAAARYLDKINMINYQDYGVVGLQFKVIYKECCGNIS